VPAAGDGSQKAKYALNAFLKVAFDTHKFHAFIVSFNWVWIPVALCGSCASKLEVMKT